MKIEDKREKVQEVPFGQVNRCSCFEFGHSLYVRVESTQGLNALDIETGGLRNITSTTPVTPVKAKLVIE